MSKLCQVCYALVRPDAYFPETFRTDECDGCGELTYVARVTKEEADEAYLDWSQED